MGNMQHQQLFEHDQQRRGPRCFLNDGSMCFLNGQLVLLKAGDDPALPRDVPFAEPNVNLGLRQLSGGYVILVH
jgi:hypothetical protein